MRANELMIGDWVYRPDCYDRVREVRNNGILGEDALRGFILEKHIKPIPLTPEILEKNGFVKVNTQRYDWGNPNGFYVNINPKKKIIHINGANGSNCNMYYIIVGFNVHELQHALRLCGLNDLADNFKV